VTGESSDARERLIDLVESVRSLPYGRPTDRTVDAMLRERRGTCSTKHLYLAHILAERFPMTEPQLVHRIYRLDHARAQRLFGAAVADTVPADGLVDVHRYLLVTIDRQRLTIDATFPGEPWDGRSSLPLACGPGEDIPAGQHPDREKRALEHEHCDPAVREPLIAALAAREAEFARLEAQQQQVEGQIERFSAGESVGRDEAHGRAPS
jgi:hypothetical protein